MLEILLVIFISKKIAAMLKEKGRTAAGYVTLFVVLWFGGEIVGAIVGLVITTINNPNDLGEGEFNLIVYFVALIGAAIGGTIGYLIPAMMPPIVEPNRKVLDDFDDDDYYGKDAARRRRNRRRRDDGSYEEAPDG